MKLKIIAKKSIAIFSVLLLILSLNISTNVSAKLEIDDDCGVAYDEFEDAVSIFPDNCTYDSLNRSVILEYEPLPFVYNHKETPGNIEAWYDDQPFFAPGGDLFTILSAITNPNILQNAPTAYEFTVTDLSTIDEEGDDKYFETVSAVSRTFNYVYHPLHLFQIQIDENIDRLDKFTVDWYSGLYDNKAYVEEIIMYMWAYGNHISRWEKIGSLEYTEDNINNDSIYYEEEAKKFISEDGIINILIIGKPTPGMDPVEPAILSSDFVQVELSTKEGYNPNGYVISDTITPTPAKFFGWESIIWESSRPTEDSNVKIQVLDSTENVIESLDGNSNGFSTSPIDLSSLGSSYPEIKLKGILHSEKYDITPRLYSWAVLWQTIEGFHDSFIYDFRIETSNGVKIENGDIKISEFYSDWPIFGKNPANTRSYVGSDVEYKGNKTYWQTYINKDIGGWFRSPVMSNGRVYISANDKKIYSFNLSLDPVHDDESAYSPVDESSPNYNVETAVAVSDGYVIVGNSTLDSINEIYALNSTNLSEKIWSKTIGDGKDICYSAAPTISNGKVYITAWSGKFANSPIVSRLVDKLNALSGYTLLNNKLIALDITNDGNEIWEAVDLPTASLSTPAVDNGLIFVGCDNIDGPSTFAFDEETGEEIWNASVGSVGRAAPVVVDGKDSKIVIFVVREQSLFSLFNGTDKVIALNAYDGSMLWNFTLGNQSTLFRNAGLTLRNFTNLKATSQPAATPAFFDDTVYVMSANGKLFALDVNTGLEKWSFDESASSAYHTASPVVVDDTVYITSQGSHLYAINSNNGELIMDYPIIYEGYTDFLAYLYASPIVTDGLVVVSILEWLLTGEFYGHLMCLGEYTRNSIGKVYSVPIHVQKDKWWNTFNATTQNAEENNTIKFSILDENNNPIHGLENLDGDDNDISDISANVIKLCAELEIVNVSEAHPILEDWKISWTTEKNPPIFNEKSFKPDPSGWINTNTPVFTIKVYDNWPGLNVDTARFRVTYTSDEKSDWIAAECTGVNGTKSNQTITANLSKLNINGDDLTLKSIEISIKDLSGNEGTFTLEEQFKLDQLKPTSRIDNKLSTHYNTPVIINGNATDPGDPDVNKSGVKSVALYYRLKGETEWIFYRSDDTYYNWEFERDTSGIYEVCTIATDKAGNVEEFPDEGESFILDMNEPSKPMFDEEYSFNILPEFFITFEDDYELERIEYKLNFHGTEEWINISDNINDNITIGEWSLSQNDWDTMVEDVKYYMYFRITDICGNQYETPSENEALIIIKDITSPIANITLDLSDFEEGSWKDTFTIIADVPDDTEFDFISLEYSYSTDKDEWSSWEQCGEKINATNAPYEWVFTAEEGSGYYKLKTKIWDAAGNVAESPEEIVNVTLFPTALVTLMIVLIVILLVITFFVIIKMKKKKE